MELEEIIKDINSKELHYFLGEDNIQIVGIFFYFIPDRVVFLTRNYSDYNPDEHDYLIDFLERKFGFKITGII